MGGMENITWGGQLGSALLSTLPDRIIARIDRVINGCCPSGGYAATRADGAPPGTTDWLARRDELDVDQLAPRVERAMGPPLR
jgi:hypothetical protein